MKVERLLQLDYSHVEKLDNKTIKLCMELFKGLPQDHKANIVVVGVINTLLKNYQNDEEMMKYLNQLLKLIGKPKEAKFIRYE
jgi:hypothetical protein